MQSVEKKDGGQTSGRLETLQPSEFAETLGHLTWLMSISKAHRHRSFSEISEAVLPALLTKQFQLVKKEEQPVFFLGWAGVTPEMKEAYLAGEASIQLKDYRSGSSIVITECISPFVAEDEVKERFFRALRENNTKKTDNNKS